MTQDKQTGRLEAIPARERFWSRIEKTDGCWIWKGSKSLDGYGWFSGFSEKKAHRASWAMHNGIIPRGMCVLHRCDNPSCVRPDHLFIGTSADNSADRVQKGRGKGINSGDRNGMRLHPERRSFGERNALAVLTEVQARTILGLKPSGASSAEVASMFGVSAPTVLRIWSRKTWSHLDEVCTTNP